MFKPGDKVRLVKDPNFPYKFAASIGAIAIVTEVEKGCTYMQVAWTDLGAPVNGQMNGGYSPRHFELVKDESTMKYQPGDKVTLKLEILEASDDLWMTTCDIISEDIVRMPTPGSKWVANDGSGYSCEAHAVVNGKVFRTKVGPSGQNPNTGSVDLELFHEAWKPA